jgi:hypothetical protein
MRAPRWNWFLTLCAGFVLSCYAPDLSTQIYKCYDGKCPEGLFCIDNVYCTEQVSECAISGIEVGAGMAACIGKAPNTMDNCGGSATTMNCQKMATPLCDGIDNCAYCCE